MNNLNIVSENTTNEDLATWFDLQNQLSDIKAKELVLRKKIFADYFSDPVEGTNNVSLYDGWVLKGKHTINRKIDGALLSTMTAEMRSQGLPIDDLVTYKPELSLTTYRHLSDEQRKSFDQVLDIKIGSPALEIVLPKRA